MPNEYSVEIHKYLSEKIAAAHRIIQDSEEPQPHVEGQIEELLWLRQYLRDNIDLEDFRYY